MSEHDVTNSADEQPTNPATSAVSMNEAEVEVEQPAVVVSEPELIATKADVDAVLDAVKELTKIVGDLHKENVKWFRAGKMGG